MKMKKLLSMGAIGLVLACSTSVGASAATIPSNADLIKIIVNQYENGKSPVGVLSGVNKDTKLGDVLTTNITDKIASQFSSHPTAVELSTQIQNNKDNSIATVLNNITVSEVKFSEFKAEFIKIAVGVQGMDTKVGTDRIAAEQKVIDIAKAYDSSFDVTFGKDNAGKTTASINKAGKILVQLNSDNLQTIIDRVQSVTWTEVSAAKALLS